MGEPSRTERRTMSRLRLASQLISAPDPAHRSPVDVVRWMAAMQAQDFLAAKWAVGLRLPGSTDAEVEGALADATIVRSWPMRGTLHFVAAEDLRWMLSLSRDRMVQRASSIHAAEGLTPTVLERLSNTTAETLQGGHAFSRDEMGSIFEREGISAQGQARYHALWWLSQTGTLCLGPPRGKQQTFVLLDEWVPNPRTLERDEALGELAQRYFLSHGPATVRDFAWWASLTLADARLGLELARPALAEREFAGVAHYLSPAVAESAVEGGRDGTHLLPAFDEYIIGYQDRRAALADEHSHRVIPGKNGMFLPTLVDDGAVVGTWKRTMAARQIAVTPASFEPLSKTAASAVLRAAKNYAKFQELPLRRDA